MQCEICSASVFKGAALYRVNAKGQKGIWRCIAHVDKLPDPSVRELVELIADNPPKGV